MATQKVVEAHFPRVSWRSPNRCRGFCRRPSVGVGKAQSRHLLISERHRGPAPGPRRYSGPHSARPPGHPCHQQEPPPPPPDAAVPVSRGLGMGCGTAGARPQPPGTGVPLRRRRQQQWPAAPTRTGPPRGSPTSGLTESRPSTRQTTSPAVPSQWRVQRCAGAVNPPQIYSRGHVSGDQNRAGPTESDTGRSCLLLSFRCDRNRSY